jgi:hypothetical protein
LDVFGTRYVVITDRVLLLLDRDAQFLLGRLVRADLPLPLAIGPVSGGNWIVLDGKPMYIPGGQHVVDKANAALRIRPSL